MMLITELKKLKLQSELISIEIDYQEDELTGIICDINDQYTAMHIYTDEGVYDGFTVFETYHITEVFWGNREHQAISHLVSQSGSVPTPKFKSRKFQDIIIELSKEYDSICFYSNGRTDIFDIGQIEKYDEKWFKIKTFAMIISLSRMHKLILRESISRIVINSPYQNTIAGLHEKGF